jgi:ArsR family transcriptional regulator, virulence genes transcriptional regulator
MKRRSPALRIDQQAMRRHAVSAAKLVRALSSEHRLMVLCALSGGELSVSQLNELVRLSPSALSQHLAVLRREGLVRTRREAQTIFYSVTPGVALDVVQLLHDHYCGSGTPAKAGPVRARKARAAA